MEQYIIVYKDGTITDWCTLAIIRSAPSESIYFICRKTTAFRYGYGEHANYVFCDKDGNDSQMVVGSLSFLSFMTTGTSRDFMLVWNFLNGNAKEKYTLHRDEVWNIMPKFDFEWEHPIKDTFRLLQDIQQIGFETRKELDHLKREIYNKDFRLDNIKNQYFLYRNVDYTKSGLHLEVKYLSLPSLCSDYKKIADGKRLSIEKRLDFLREELSKRESTIKQLHEANELYEKYVSLLEKCI